MRARWTGRAVLLRVVPVILLCCSAALAHTADCGHNAVRHLQHAQLQKVHGDDYLAAHQQYRQRHLGDAARSSSSSSSSSVARRLQQGTKQAPSRLVKLLQDNQASTLRVTPVFQLEGSGLTAQQASQVRDVLVPGAIRVLQQYIKVRLPAQRPVKAVREPMDQYCGEADADAVYKGDGFSSTDHVFYVTAKKTGSCSDNTIAYTIICNLEPFTFRPNVAAINLCPRFWSLGEPLGSKQVSALVHEMIHGLGFSDRMFPFLYDSQTGIQYEEVVQEHKIGSPFSSSSARHFAPPSSTSIEDVLKQPVQFQDGPKNAAEFEAASKSKVLFLVTPRLAAFAREYYACPSLPGAPADAFSEGSHWRQANINHELMQPASAEDSQRKRISAFTLSFLEDTGWYVTDKAAAQELEWGRGAGCSFLVDSCSTWAASNAGRQSYYCSDSQSGKDVCTHDSRGIGTCSPIPGTGCYTARADAAKPLLYCQDAGSFARSGRQGLAAAFAAVGGSTGSQASRCLSTPQKVCTAGACAADAGAALCAAVSCDGSGRLFVELKVGGKSMKLPCSDGAVLDLPKLQPGTFKSGQLACPAAARVCPTLGCTGGCANGYCWQGRCYCHLEFTGSTCSQSLVPKLWNNAAGQTVGSNWRTPLL